MNSRRGQLESLLGDAASAEVSLAVVRSLVEESVGGSAAVLAIATADDTAEIADAACVVAGRKRVWNWRNLVGT